MDSVRTAALRGIAGMPALVLWLMLTGCPTPYELRHEGQWDSRDQVWLSEQSQVKLRAAQSRVFETIDRRRTIEAVIDTMQDLGFMVEVLDENIGIVSGKRFEPLERSSYFNDPFYHLYSDESLVVFTRAYRSWGPFWHRSDLVRLTVTVRKRNEAQLVVRASAQYYLKAVEDPLPYQRFFRTLEQALFLQGMAAE